jgi:Protein of unknown function (DUF2786)
MERDYAAIIAAMREKARRSEFPEEKKALNTKADELQEKYKVNQVPVYETDPSDWIGSYLIVITGEDQKWRHSYLWPVNVDNSPMMNPYHPWDDTEE